MNDQTSVPSIPQTPPNSAAQPAPRAKRKGRLRRIYPSTWLVMLLASSVMFLIEFPGHRRTPPFSGSSYTHGWPLAWMEGRDGSGGAQWLPPAPVAASQGGPIIQTMFDRNEEKRDPWSMRDDLQAFDPIKLGGDVGLALLAVVFVGWIFQHWRRRHGSLLRFRLRTLMVGVALVAMLIAPVAQWHREWQKEQQIIDGLKSECISGLAVSEAEALHNNGDRTLEKESVGAIQIAVDWTPPGWLPETLAKVGGVRRLFDRVNLIIVRGERFTDATLAPLIELSNLGSLEIAQGEVDDAGFQTLARLANLKSLRLQEATVTDRRLAQLSALSQLDFLAIGKSDVSDAGLAALARLHNLGCLWIASNKLTGKGFAHLKGLSRLTGLNIEADGLTEEGVTAIEQLQTLGGLVLKKTPLRTLHLDGLRQLSELELLDNVNLEAVDLRGMAALTHVFIKSGKSANGKVPHPTVRLRDVDRLQELVLDGAALDPVELTGLSRQDLWVLELHNVQFGGARSLDVARYHWLGKLEVSGSELAEIRAADNESLLTIRLSKNPRLATIRLKRLPNLEAVELTDNRCLASLDLRNAEQLQRLAISIDDEHGAYDNRRVRLGIHGLGSVSELRSLSVRHPGPIDAEFLGDLSRLQKLREVTLSSECVRDEDLSALSRLKNLASLDLSHGSIAGEGLVHLHGLSSLTTIDLRCTPVSDEAVASLQKALAGLTVVQFESKKPVVQDLRSQVALVRSRLSAGIACKLNPEKLADRDFECLSDLDNLETLDLAKTHLTDAGLQYLRRLPKLRSLSLRRTQITDAGIRALKDFPALTHLDIEETLISAEGRRALGQLIAPPVSGER